MKKSWVTNLREGENRRRCPVIKDDSDIKIMEIIRLLIHEQERDERGKFVFL